MPVFNTPQKSQKQNHTLRLSEIINHFKIDIKKLSEYCLNAEHPVGKHKARVFHASLGIVKRDATLLKQEIEKQIQNADLIKEFEDEYGVRYSAVVSVDIYDKTATIKTIWIVRSGQNVAELVTCFIHN